MSRGLRGAFMLFLLVAGSALGMEASVVVTVGQAGEAFVVDAVVEAPASLRTAWEVLTDFERMTAILSNLSLSQVVRRDGDRLLLRQEGTARYGLMSYRFETEREIRLEPMRRILAKALSGSARRMESEARLQAQDDGVHIDYHAEIVPDSVLARMFGAPFVRHEVEEQFQSLVREMLRRQETVPGSRH